MEDTFHYGEPWKLSKAEAIFAEHEPKYAARCLGGSSLRPAADGCRMTDATRPLHSESLSDGSYPTAHCARSGLGDHSAPHLCNLISYI